MAGVAVAVCGGLPETLGHLRAHLACGEGPLNDVGAFDKLGVLDNAGLVLVLAPGLGPNRKPLHPGLGQLGNVVGPGRSVHHRPRGITPPVLPAVGMHRRPARHVAVVMLDDLDVAQFQLRELDEAGQLDAVRDLVDPDAADAVIAARAGVGRR